MATSKRPFKVDELNEEARGLWDTINHEHPLPCVLISTAYIEQCLATLLHSVFIKGSTSDDLFDHEKGVLKDISSRAKLAYSLGMIPKTLFQNLRKIGEIRNRFAHSHLTVDFSDPEIDKLCRELSRGMPFIAAVRVDGRTGETTNIEENPLGEHSAKTVFKIAAAITANSLVMHAMKNKEEEVGLRPKPSAASTSSLGESPARPSAPATPA